MEFCFHISAHQEIEEFVTYECWCTPGLTIVHDKCMKRKKKLESLLANTGYWGPLMDLVIRATVSHMLVLHLAEDTKSVCGIDMQCRLHSFLKKYFTSIDLLATINKWMGLQSCVVDYEIAYRQKRNELIAAQVIFLINNPTNVVSILFLFKTFVLVMVISLS